VIRPIELLLTGGTGFIGRALLRTLRSKTSPARNIWVISRDPKAFMNQYPTLGNSIRLIKADVTNRESLPFTMKFDQVIHAASDTITQRTGRRPDIGNQIVVGTRNILELAKTSGARRFLFLSSGAVYGSHSFTEVGVSETQFLPSALDHLRGSDTYSDSKRTAEALCRSYFEESALDVLIARCFSFVGRDLPLTAQFAIGNFIYDALRGNEITVSGSGNALRTYLDQSDLADWLLRILEFGRAGEIYNVGSDQAITTKDLALMVRALLAPNKSVRVLGDPAADNLARSIYIPNISKIREELGVRLSISLPDAIRYAAHNRTSN